MYFDISATTTPLSLRNTAPMPASPGLGTAAPSLLIISRFDLGKFFTRGAEFLLTGEMGVPPIFLKTPPRLGDKGG
jgi:hypothetical protein